MHCLEPSACEDILRPLVSTGLWFGAMMPYALAALTMESAVEAATEMEKERIKRFPELVEESAQPDYEKCILLSIKASLNIFTPGALVILSLLFPGCCF